MRAALRDAKIAEAKRNRPHVFDAWGRRKHHKGDGPLVTVAAREIVQPRPR